MESAVQILGQYPRPQYRRAEGSNDSAVPQRQDHGGHESGIRRSDLRNQDRFSWPGPNSDDAPEDLHASRPSGTGRLLHARFTSIDSADDILAGIKSPLYADAAEAQRLLRSPEASGLGLDEPSRRGRRPDVAMGGSVPMRGEPPSPGRNQALINDSVRKPGASLAHDIVDHAVARFTKDQIGEIKTDSALHALAPLLIGERDSFTKVVATLVADYTKLSDHFAVYALPTELPGSWQRQIVDEIQTHRYDIAKACFEAVIARDESDASAEIVESTLPQGNERRNVIVSSIMRDVGEWLAASTAFHWLVRQIRVCMACTVDYAGAAHFVNRDTLIDALCQTVEWQSTRDFLQLDLPSNPRTFFEEQYPSDSGARLSDVICLVGRPEAAFATTCASYAELVWPGLGPRVIGCFDYLCREMRARDNLPLITSYSGRIDDRLDMRLSNVRPGSLSVSIVLVEGSQLVASTVALLEAAEVLCWLAAVCQHGANSSIVQCRPTLRLQEVPGPEDLAVEIHSQPLGLPTIPTQGVEDVRCWMEIFHSPVLVGGYPMPRRANDEPGLEIQLELMVMLSDAYRATLFDGMLVLKGFSTMLVHVARVGSSSIWHFLRSNDWSWLCYSEAKPYPRCEATFDHLTAQKHFVGFARAGNCSAGVENAPYNSIQFAGKRYDKSGLALDGVTVNVAKYVGIATKFTPGNRDSAVLHAFDGKVPFRKKISQASDMHVVLYGADDRRAWFLDGASALLHLSRAALTHHRAADIRKGFAVTEFHHAVSDPHCSRTAKEALLNEKNRKLDLEGDSTYTFEKLVEGYLEVLLEIFSHQLKLRSGAAKQWQLRGVGKRRRLEGFSFVDLLCAKPATRPRYVDLERSASGWLPFINKAGAIVLMGTQFGPVLQAMSTPCAVQRHVPMDLDLLVVPLARLRLLSEEIGQSEGGNADVQLIDDIWWNEPHESFGLTPCACTPHLRGISCVCHCARLTAQLGDRRKKWYRGKRKVPDSVFELYPDGLVVFGHRDAVRKMAFRQLRGLDTPPAGASRGDTGSSTTSQGSSSGFADSSLSPPSTTSLAPKIQPSTVASTSGRSSGSSQSSRDSAARSMSAQASSSIATSGRTRDVVIALMPPESSVGELDVEQDDSSPSLHATLTTRHAFPGSEQRSRGSSRWARRPLPQTRHVSQRTFHAAIAAEPCTSSSLIDSEDQDPPMHFATGPSGQIPVYPTRPPEFTYKSAGADKIS